MEIGRLVSEFELPPEQARVFERSHRIRSIRVDPEADYAGLLVRAANNLCMAKKDCDRIRYVAVAQGRRSKSYSPNILQELCLRLGITNARCFVVDQWACASGLKALSMVGELVAAHQDQQAEGLVLAGEKVIFGSKVRFLPDIAMASECCAAVLLGTKGDGDVILGESEARFGKPGRAGESNVISQYRAYRDMVAEAIENALSAAKLTVQDVSRVFPHNVYHAMWIAACRRLRIPPERVHLRTISTLAHCFAADPFLNFVDATSNQEGLGRGSIYMMVAAGWDINGLCASAMVFECGDRSNS